MIDLKAASPGLHRFLTGRDNARVISSIRHLHELGLLHEVRLLVVEGYTDRREELAAWAALVGAVDPAIRVRLMAFRHAGTRPAAHHLPETVPETMERVAAVLRAEGLTRVETPAGSLTG
jgi:pyruvate formate lyase activating enzyme